MIPALKIMDDLCPFCKEYPLLNRRNAKTCGSKQCIVENRLFHNKNWHKINSEKHNKRNSEWRLANLEKHKTIYGGIKERYISKHSYLTKSGLTHRYIFQLTRNGVTENLCSSKCLEEVVRYRDEFLREECPHLCCHADRSA